MCVASIVPVPVEPGDGATGLKETGCISLLVKCQEEILLTEPSPLLKSKLPLFFSLIATKGIYPKFDLLLVVKKLLEESPKFRFVPQAYICPVLTLLLSNIKF